MKTYIKSILLSALCLAGIAMASCSKTDAEEDEGKTPVIEYVRVCAPNQSDSLLVAANMGDRIAFMGHNLGDVQQVWFNDQKAKLNPAYVTSNTIIVDVPNVLSEPENVTNKVRFITSKGIEVDYDFKVIVPNPSIISVSCEYAEAGDVISISGDYFIGTADDVKVIFPGASGDIEVSPSSYTKTDITVVVPDGVVEGFLKVKSMYGTSRYVHKFMDTTGLITNFDDGYVNPWGYPDAGVTDVDGVSGKFMKFYADNNGAWNWTSKLMWGYWAYAGKGNRPIATGDITKLALKFECNIITWQDCPLLIWFQKYQEGGAISPDDDYAQCHWKPYLNSAAEKVNAKTDGWITVTIPLTEFKYNKDESATDKTIGDISQYTDLNIQMFGAADGTAPVEIWFDNFRIVTIE
ncbi:MAG: glycan-binding surface protein [Muribaculaceae bacterium]